MLSESVYGAYSIIGGRCSQPELVLARWSPIPYTVSDYLPLPYLYVKFLIFLTGVKIYHFCSKLGV